MKISSWPLKASNINIYGHWAMIQETGPPYITPIDSLLLLGSCWINSHHLFRSRRYDADLGSNPLYLTVWLTKPLGHPQRGFDTFRKKPWNVCITYSIIIFPIFRESEENGIWESQSYCIYVYRKGLSNYRAVGVLRIGSFLWWNKAVYIQTLLIYTLLLYIYRPGDVKPLIRIELGSYPRLLVAPTCRKSSTAGQEPN